MKNLTMLLVPAGLAPTTQAVEGVGSPNLAGLVTGALYGHWLDVAKTADFVGVQTIHASGSTRPARCRRRWTSGYGQNFGLAAVDPTTFRRRPKPSAHHFGARAHANLV